MILYVNSCIRKPSRTDDLAREVLAKLGGEYEEVKLAQMHLKSISNERLEKRTELVKEGKFDDPMFDLARQFAAADTIVIGAPYWDLSFPAKLKLYIENIYVMGIVSKYSEHGFPVGLCKAKKLYYVTTAGGPYLPDYSFDYITTMATQVFGISETKLIKAEMLDVVGYNPERIMKKAKETIEL